MHPNVWSEIKSTSFCTPLFNQIKLLNEVVVFKHQYREKPLALYIFSKKTDVRETILSNTSCGGVTVNDTAMHLAGSLFVCLCE